MLIDILLMLIVLLMLIGMFAALPYRFEFSDILPMALKLFSTCSVRFQNLFSTENILPNAAAQSA